MKKRAKKSKPAPKPLHLTINVHTGGTVQLPSANCIDTMNVFGNMASIGPTGGFASGSTVSCTKPPGHKP